MTGIGQTASMSARNSLNPTPRANPHQPPSDDVHAMRDAFARADTRLPLASERARKGGPKLANGKAAPNADQAEQVDTAKPHDQGRDRLDADRDSHQDNQQGLFSGVQQAVSPIAVPDMPGPHVDPSAFAQLMTQLWLREKGKGSREVRVSFGGDAWPATGARLVRSAGGALDIQLHVADGGAAYQGNALERLHSELANHGLVVGGLRLETGTLA